MSTKALSEMDIAENSAPGEKTAKQNRDAKNGRAENSAPVLSGGQGTKLHKIWPNHPSPLCCHGPYRKHEEIMNTLFRLLWIYLKVCWHERKLRRLNAAVGTQASEDR
jgi:hypothetical protein